MASEEGDAHLPPLRFLSERRRCRAPQMDFLIRLFAGTSVKLRPRGYSDSRLSRAGTTKDAGKAGMMRCQAGHAVIVNHIYSCAAGTPPPCFQEYKAPSSNVFLLRSNGSTPSLTESNKWEGGGGLTERCQSAALAGSKFPGPCVDGSLFASPLELVATPAGVLAGMLVDVPGAVPPPSLPVYSPSAVRPPWVTSSVATITPYFCVSFRRVLIKRLARRWAGGRR